MHLKNNFEFLVSLMISKSSYWQSFSSLFVNFTEIFPNATLTRKPCPQGVTHLTVIISSVNNKVMSLKKQKMHFYTDYG